MPALCGIHMTSLRILVREGVEETAACAQPTYASAAGFHTHLPESHSVDVDHLKLAGAVDGVPEYISR